VTGMRDTRCELCLQDGGEILAQHPAWRVVLIHEPDIPGFCRVIWNAHVREMSDLSATEREQLMSVVWAVEQAIRTVLAPHKINLASLGNVTPHLHWHIIPRWENDSYFPAPIWAEKRRQPLLPNYAGKMDSLRQAIVQACARLT
jgi:diadenosine tetraphosphate (Ap4A) HIT family hydrolase